MKTSRPSSEELKKVILSVLDDAKAENILSADIGKKTSLADVLIIASGTSSRHVFSLAEMVGKKLKEIKVSFRIDGKEGTGDWVILDAGDVIVHIFHPETREKYNLEELWGLTAIPKEK